MKRYADLQSNLKKLRIKSLNDNTLDELYALPIFEYQMYLKFLSVHPSQFLFNTAAVGLSSDIGLLVQNVVSLEYYVSEDPDSEYYEELS